MPRIVYVTKGVDQAESAFRSILTLNLFGLTFEIRRISKES